MNTSVLTVSQLNFFIKSMFEAETRLQRVAISGEISNFVSHYQSGHLYFSLKDDKAAVKVVMFRSNASRLRFLPKNGMKVVVTGRVSVFERDGQYQLYADAMIPDGAGALALAFEQLKEKLQREGLFAPERKKPIPQFPHTIGVVTAKTGAAVRDILNILNRRWPLAAVLIAPVIVQGDQAALSIVSALNELNARHACDVIIVGRGGGSMEDLWAFNEESLVRAVAASEIPVISAVGHETDFTLCDFAADLRAPTPSAAAELAVPDQMEIRAALDLFSRRLVRAQTVFLASCENALSRFGSDGVKRQILHDIDAKMLTCDHLSSRLRAAQLGFISNQEKVFRELVASLDALSPLKVLSRGYALCQKDGEAVTTVSQLHINDEIRVLFRDGSADCRMIKEPVYEKDDI